MRAKVKWFNDPKGYGFATTPKGDVFLHYSQIEGEGFKTLAEGQEIDFDLYETEKGLQAKGIKKV